MIVIEGKEVLTELAELVAPAHTALVLVDMQRDFLEPDGVFGRLGVDLSMYAAMRPRVAALLTAARRPGVLVVHVQNTTLPGRRSDSPAQRRFNLRLHAPARAGGPGAGRHAAGLPGARRRLRPARRRPVDVRGDAAAGRRAADRRPPRGRAGRARAEHHAAGPPERLPGAAAVQPADARSGPRGRPRGWSACSGAPWSPTASSAGSASPCRCTRRCGRGSPRC